MNIANQWLCAVRPEKQRVVFTILRDTKASKMEFPGTVHLEGHMGVNQAMLNVALHGECKEEFAELNKDAWDQGWTMPTRISSHGSWIDHMALNANWVIEMAVVKFWHWSDQALKFDVEDFVKMNHREFAF